MEQLLAQEAISGCRIGPRGSSCGIRGQQRQQQGAVRQPAFGGNCKASLEGEEGQGRQ